MCGKHQAELLQEPIPLHDLKENILRAQQKNVELLKVRMICIVLCIDLLTVLSTDNKVNEATLHYHLL